MVEYLVSLSRDSESETHAVELVSVLVFLLTDQDEVSLHLVVLVGMGDNTEQDRG